MAVSIAVLAIILSIATHLTGAPVSFDEGFHGEAALFFGQTLYHFVPGVHTVLPRYLFSELSNGVTLYPPAWALLAGLSSLFFGAKIFVFRAVTSFFYGALILMCYWLIIRTTRSQKAALLTALAVATSPLIVVYSNLMMLEVPLAWGIAACLICFYLYAFDYLKPGRSTTLWIMLVFALGVNTKIVALPIILGTMLTFAVLTSILFYRQKAYRHFLKPEFLLFILAGALTLGAYIYLENRFLHVNMLDFHLSQTANLEGGQKAGALAEAWNIFRTHYSFYLRDFRHMPLLTDLWFGSLALYLVWKRTPLALFLATWTAVCWIVFSSVMPQAVQYILPIYVPLAIAASLMLVELLSFIKAARLQNALYIWICVSLSTAQLAAISLTESSGYRLNDSDQEAAAEYIAEHAAVGDRVLSWFDGNTFAVRMAGFDKKLQIVQGGEEICSQAMSDSVEWAIDIRPESTRPSDIDRGALATDPWKQVAVFGVDSQTVVYHNDSTKLPYTIEAENMDANRAVSDIEANNGRALMLTPSPNSPSFWGCLRVQHYGAHTATFRVKVLAFPVGVPDSATMLYLEYSGYPYGEQSGQDITVGQLRALGPGYHEFTIHFDHETPDLRSEVKARLTGASAQAVIDSVTIK